MRIRSALAGSCFAWSCFAVGLTGPLAGANAQSTDVVVGVPVRDGQVGRPQPGVIVDLEKQQRDRVPAPIVVQEGQAGGTTTVRPNFGGGYTVDQSGGSTTTVKPRFGGGYSVEENGRTTTEVKPNFGGGYTVESTGKGPTVVLPPPQR
jgi:hypothetical protein